MRLQQHAHLCHLTLHVKCFGIDIQPSVLFIAASSPQVITPDMRGFLIADDMASVVVLRDADDSDFQHWQQHRGAQQQQQQQDLASADTKASQLGLSQPPLQTFSDGKDTDTVLVEGLSADTNAATEQQQQQQQHSSGVSWGRLRGHMSRQASIGSSGDLRHSSSAISLDMRRGPRRKGAGMLLAQQRQLSTQEVRC
jgi:hypothetical protein